MAETTEQYRNRINQIKTSIENEPYIMKMREDIAEGVSKTGYRQADIEVRQNTLEDDFVAVQQDSSSTSPSGAEVAVARGSYPTLDQRLTEEEQKIKSQLAQNTNEYKPFLNDNKKTAGLTHIMAGIDSLTNGAGGSSWGQSFVARAKGEIKDGGLGYIGFNNASVVNDGHSWSFNGMSSLENLDQSIYPGKYSLDNKGLYAESASGSSIVITLKEKKFKHAKVIYLKQPGGGTFNAKHSTETSGVAVNTSAPDFDLGSSDLNDVAHTGQIIINGITGKVVIFGLFLYNDEGLIFSKLGKGGDTLLNHSKTDSDFRKKWLDVLKPDVLFLNAGTNDRNSMSAPIYKEKITSYLEPYVTSGTQVVLVRPNAVNGDVNLDVFAEKLREIQKEFNFGYIDEKTLLGGSYEEADKLGYMYDSIHPSSKGNKKRTSNYLEYLGIPKIGINYSSVLEYQYKTDLTSKKIDVPNGQKTLIYKIGLINGYPNAMLKLNIKGLRVGSAGMVEKELTASIRNGTTINNALFSDYQQSTKYEYHPDTTVTDFNATLAVENNLLCVYILPNTGSSSMNFYIEGSITMLYVAEKGQNVFEN